MITVRPMRLLPRSPPLDVTEVLLLVVVFAVPVAVVPWASNAFELPKAALLCFLVLILAALGLGQFLIADRQRRLRWRAGWRHPLLWPVVAFSLALVLATLQSTNLLVSLRGSYERQQGLLTQLAYPTLLLLTVPLLRTRQQMARLWEALVWTSAPVVAYGLLQALGVDPLGWQTDATSPVLSTLGRANFLGSYLVLMAPLTGGLLLINRRRSLLALLLLGQLTCLALTLARGAWIGLAAALLTLALAWAWHTGQRRLAAMALGTTLLLLALLVLLNLPQRPLGSLADLPGLDRLASLSDTRAGSSAARLTIWRATLPLLQARPWLGYGPETMRTTFAAVYPPQLVYYQGRQTVVDRAHNLWLDLGMSAGLLGILTFTAVLAAFIRMAWRALRAACDRYYNNTQAPGVYGRSLNGVGVYGVGETTHEGVRGESVDGQGLHGVSTNDAGVYGYSTNDIGVYGRTGGSTGADAGVYGLAGAGAYGVHGYQSGASSGLGSLSETQGTGSGASGLSSSSGNGTWGYSANGNGLASMTGRADNNYGLFTYDNLYSLNFHSFGAAMQIVQNGDQGSLQQGDVVAIAGLGDSPVDGVPLLRVAKASEANSSAVIGVVYSTYSAAWLADPAAVDPTGASGRAEPIPPTGPGPVAPGDYLLIVVRGPCLVKADAAATPIQIGDLLASSSLAGHAARAARVTVDGVQLAIPGTVFAKALAPLAAGQKLVAAYVTLQ